MPDTLVAWPDGWKALEDSAERSALEDQLYRELVYGHPLHRLVPHVIARREDDDRVLTSVSDGRVAEVHLTWGDRMAGYPVTVFHETLADWARSQAEE